MTHILGEGGFSGDEGKTVGQDYLRILQNNKASRSRARDLQQESKT
jgi:hypothetical protein